MFKPACVVSVGLWGLSSLECGPSGGSEGILAEQLWKGWPEKVIALYAKGDPLPSDRYPSTAGHVKSCGNLGGPPPKAKYSPTTDSGQVP
jgi:hypothetical protein